jgi:superfamily I DNA/RNA helicase
MPKKHFFVNEDELDDFQVQLLQKRIDRSMVVSGCAGSGKSILALWKAKQIQDAGYSYKFIVFTKALHQFMSDGIKTIGLNNNNFTYHYDWCNKQGCPSADFIIVDEVQDFEREKISQFKQAAKQAFFFWGDSEQSIYQGFRDTQNILSIAAEAGIQPETLVFNHRLPKKIARFAAKVKRDEELVQRCRKEGEDIPRILRYATFGEQLDAIMQQIKNRQITDAAILLHNNEWVQKAYDYLRNKGYAIEAKIGQTIFDLDFFSDNPKLMTYHSAKGLQFEAVFLPNCEADLEPSNEKTMNANSFYVAVTRSYRYIFVMYSNKLVRFFEAVSSDLYSTTLEEEKIEL